MAPTSTSRPSQESSETGRARATAPGRNIVSLAVSLTAMQRGIWMGLLICYACLAAEGCTTPCRPRQPDARSLRKAPPRIQETARSDTRSPVHVELLSCEVVKPIELEEELSEGRFFTSLSDSPASVRLHLQVENRSNRPLLVAFCNGGLALVSQGSREPACERFGFTGWLPLEPASRVLLYPAIPMPPPGEGSFTERLLPRLGHAPIVYWLRFKPNPVSFELTAAACSPLPSAG